MATQPAALAFDDPLYTALMALGEELQGEVRLEPLYRMLYAQDASLYAEEPLGVVYPAHRDDCVKIVRFAAQWDVPLIPRTAGTSLAGQCVGSGLVVDVSRHMTDIVEIDEQNMQVTVQPGVILDELNRALEPHALFFGPDTSTSNRCMIGGMIGNNSCGSHSIMYGNTMAHVLQVEAVLSDGSVVRWGEMSPMRVNESSRRTDREGTVFTALTGLVEAHRDTILERYPKPEVKRRNMGYPLDFLAVSERFHKGGHPWNLGKFLCGSEGTLALITEATLNLVPLPRHKLIVAAHFTSVHHALRGTVAAVEHSPAAVELIDDKVIEATADNLEQQRNRDWILGDPQAVLIVELYGDTEDAVQAAAQAVIADLEEKELGYAFPIVSGADMNKVWALRKAGLGLLMGIVADRKPITFVEDTAVAVQDLPDYIKKFRAIIEKHGTDCVYYAHASVGELHLRPQLDPKDPGDIETMKSIATDVADLVNEFRGSLSGEHGDGRVRSPFIEQVLGEELVDVLGQVKHAFDPQGIFNPGKIVDPEPIDADLRYEPGRPPPEVDAEFRYTSAGGTLLAAVERCNGAGACRKLATAGGTMCPSYHATLDELHTTRGRANVFRNLLLGNQPELAMKSHELHEAMELCIGCKGCKSECPASVDMGRLKAEFLQHYHDEHGVPRSTRRFGSPEGGYKLAQTFARLSNWGVKTGLGKWVFNKLYGVDKRRDLPDFAPQTLRQWLKKRGPSPDGPNGLVFFFVDLFTDYNDPHVGIAAVEVLEAAGYQVVTTEHPPAGRPQLSKGLVREARKIANRNVRELINWARKDIPIVGVEPSEILSLLDEYPDLVDEELRDDAIQVAKQVQLVDVFIGEMLASGEASLDFAQPDPGQEPVTVKLHGHCHQKALVGNEPVANALRQVPGYNVEIIPSGCCGMAGSFGYEEKHYDLSMKIGELVLFPAVRQSEGALIAAPGTSCRHQIKDGTGTQAKHPIELIRDALADG